MATPYVADSKRGYYLRHYVSGRENFVELKAKTCEQALRLSSLYPVGAEYDLFWNDGVEEHYLGRLKAPINRTRSGMSTEEMLIFLDEELETVRSSLEGRVFNDGHRELNTMLLTYAFLQSKRNELTLTMYGIES